MAYRIPDLIENQHDNRGGDCHMAYRIPDLIENQHDN